MAYTPKTWQCGETITANDLNHMEQGIAQGGSEPLIVRETVSGNTHTLDHTWQEIYDAYPNVAMYAEEGDFFSLQPFNTVNGSSALNIYEVNRTWATDSPNGYPSYTTTPI